MPKPIENFPSRPRLLVRGLTRRCAWCGSRRAFFTGWFKRQETCVDCGHGYRRGDHAFELGATTMNYILTFLGVLLAVLIASLVTAPGGIDLWIVVGAAITVALLAPIIMYPISYTVWQAVDLWMRQPTDAELRGESDATL